MPASSQEKLLASQERLLAELNEKLDVLIKVSSIQVGADKSTTERARLLKMAGVDNRTIADVLNTSVAVVRTLTSNLRKKGSTR
jgi:DNA-binding NarL/FixJ family response regulator